MQLYSFDIHKKMFSEEKGSISGTIHLSTNAEKETRFIQYGPLLLLQ
jgi:hypothetical protein